MSWRVPREWRDRVRDEEAPRFPGLGARLASAANEVAEGARVVDVGTDHGMLAQALVESRRATCVVAIDRSPLALARATLNREGRVLLVRSHGLDAVRASEYDCATLVGLGGRNVIEIVRRAAATGEEPKHVIAQPLTLHAEVREATRALGYRVADERLVHERGRLFLTMSFESGAEEAESRVDRWIGGALLRRGGVLFDAWIDAQLESLRGSESHRDARRRERWAALCEVRARRTGGPRDPRGDPELA